MISIVTPSLGHIDMLSKLCTSIAQQRETPYELLLCTTGAPPELESLLSSKLANIRYFNSPEKCISHARNLGIHNSVGDLILFLDEDCQLPHDSYLKDLYQAYLENPKICGGGFYLNEKDKINFTSSFYNYFCNFWLNLNLNDENSAKVLLGGCCFYAKQVLQEHQIEFSAFFRKSGEEYGFNSQIINKGYPLYLQQRWSVYHNSDCNFKGLLKKAWRQGQTLDERSIKPKLRFFPILKFLIRTPFESLKGLPLLTLYYLVGRTAHLSRRWR